MTVPDHFYAVEVAACARRLEQIAVTVRHRAATLGAAAERCRWDGQGAWAFLTSAAATTARLRRAASLLDEAAGALRRHGAAVASAVAAHDEEREREQARLREQLHHVVGR